MGFPVLCHSFIWKPFGIRINFLNHMEKEMEQPSPIIPITTPEGILSYLSGLGIASRTVEHRAVFTVAEGVDVKENIPGAHTKNLFVKDKKGKLFLITAKDYTAINLKKTHETIGASGRLSFCTEEQMSHFLGVTPGSVTPLAIVNDRDLKVSMILDANLMDYDVINCHPLINTMTTSLNRADLLAFLEKTGHPPHIVTLPEPVEHPPSS